MTQHHHHVLLITGGKEHECHAGPRAIASALKAAGLQVTASPHAGPLAGGKFKAVVLYAPGDQVSDADAEALTDFVRAGGGVVGIHCGNGHVPSAAYRRLLGSRLVSHSPVAMDFEVQISDPDHPIAHRLQSFRIRDTLHSVEPTEEIRTFLTAWWEGRRQPMAYTKNEGAGRVVCLANGHEEQALSDPSLQRVLVRSVRYAAGEEWANKTVSVAAIGYGVSFSMGKLHLESCRRARLWPVAVCDSDPNRLGAARAELGQDIQTFNRVEDLLASGGSELCVIITPHNTHGALALRCLEANRHVVTEKPFTISIDEATAVIDAAKKHKKMATVFHNRRWDGDFRAIRRVVESGRLGEIFSIECAFGGYEEPRTDWWRSYKDASGGAFYDWGAHFVDWILQLIPQPVESVSGWLHKRKWHQVTNEDHCQAMIRFEGGGTAYLEQSNLAAIGKARFRILGTQGGIEQWHGSDVLKVVTYDRATRVEIREPYLPDEWDAFYRNVADHLILGEPLAVTPESARKVIAVLSLAEASSRQGGVPMALPFKQ